jgi:hypothetical protein
MDWRQPADEFARQLAAARETFLAHTTEPWHAVEPFEPILEALKYVPSAREGKLSRVRSLGRELFAELRSFGGPVSMEVRHYSWHLQHLDDPDGSPSPSLKAMLMATLTRFAHYEGHQVDRCFICAEFPSDLPFQGSPGGRAHFHEWIRRRSGDEYA